MTKKVNQRRPQGKSAKDEYYPEDKQKKHDEIEQIKANLVNFALSYWGQEWIKSTLESGRPYRMQRGIEYAKETNRIDNISISKGQLFSTVQGTAPMPYRVKIKFEIIPEEGWQKIIHQLSHSTINLIELINGVLPIEIINIFEENHFPLFLSSEINPENTTCSCPDQAIPCKHIAATILYVARVLDYDPFILLTLRGKTKNEILNDLKLTQKIESSFSKELSKKRESNVELSFNVPKISFNEINEKEKDIEKEFNINFHFKKPGKIIETLENLGTPIGLEDRLAFEMVMDSIYRTISNESYKKSMEYTEKN